DGYLWWALGDGGGSNDQFDNGQNPRTLLGSLVRIDVDGGDPYVIPPDNPFADGSGGAPELFVYGLRNPFRFAFDPVTDDLYIADVGQNAVEEIDVLAAGTGAGSNFGWPIFEGSRPFRGGELPDHVPPVWEETHSEGNCSITGGVVYRGQAIPELYGAYLYSDLCRNSIRAILVQDGQVTQDTDLGISVGSPVGFGIDHAGEVHVMSLGGAVVKIVPG
ncbi:MAG TPA: PQQ-dependent sugar dehydrogenase, partial [Euzebya sp.]|nr:PQQ-dependent sugar dehydrogenase [Euzebya sp.]